MQVYTIKGALRGISPMVWRRFRLHGDTSLGALHFIIQSAFGWDNEYLHSFHIYGEDYGISYDGGIGFSDNPWLITLELFKFELHDRFTYEYNFYRHWLLDIRIERIDEPSKKKTPFCLSGHGMPDATKYDETECTLDLMQAIAELDETTTIGDIRVFIEALNRVRFNRHQFNHQLHERARSDSPKLEPRIGMIASARASTCGCDFPAVSSSNHSLVILITLIPDLSC